MNEQKVKAGKYIWIFLLMAVAVAAPGNIYAQKTDTLSPLRDFVSISNGYKQMPMYLSLEMKNSTNFITAEDDTTDIQGEFFLRNENSYVHFGEFEQLVNDSLALLVSDKLQQMILYSNAGPVVKNMKSMMGVTLPDSSLRILAGRYTSSAKQLSEASASIELQSRMVLYGTSLPKETIELQYDVIKKQPQQVTTLRRSLLRLDSLQYVQLQNENSTAGSSALLWTVLSLEGNYFLVKEQFAVYIYKKIEQASAAKVPVLISDRITRTEEGEYLPVKKYEAYRLTKND